MLSSRSRGSPTWRPTPYIRRLRHNLSTWTSQRLLYIHHTDGWWRTFDVLYLGCKRHNKHKNYQITPSLVLPVFLYIIKPLFHGPIWIWSMYLRYISNHYILTRLWRTHFAYYWEDKAMVLLHYLHYKYSTLHCHLEMWRVFEWTYFISQ